MTWQTSLNAFVKLQQYLKNPDDALQATIMRASQVNPWFTTENIWQAVNAIADKYLDADKLSKWISRYTLNEDAKTNTIGIVMAGNIPLVGFHDLICVLASGNKALVKLSSKDQILPLHIIDAWKKLVPELEDQIIITEKLSDFDAVIATGSDNTSRYFEYYFSKYPHIIRKNRNSIAVLSGNESDEELMDLGKDVFDYFGMGCRNVSKIYVPEGYDLAHLLSVWEHFNPIKDHNKYKNNLDYNLTLLIMNQRPHLASEYLALKEDPTLTPRIACLHYQNYKSTDQVNQFIKANAEHIQCVVSTVNDVPGLRPGQAQQPELWDYADNVDTMAFLLSLN